MNVKDVSTIRTETAERDLRIAVNATECTQEQTEVIMPTDTKRRTSMTESEIFDAMIDNAWDDHEELLAYRAIGTIERFRELTEKAEPKKPKSRDFYSGYKCGSCGTNIPYQNQKYCCDCGTAIDWQ